MTERPILFSASMVRAILDGSKTQTRRMMRPQPHGCVQGPIPLTAVHPGPFGVPGDRLWVRETWAWPGEEEFLYRATDQHVQDKMRSDPLYPQFNWRSPIHMPRRASRITLEVTGVRVERLQDISEDDAGREGVERRSFSDRWVNYGPDKTVADWSTRRESFASLWESINGPASWNANPWVWVVEFCRAEQAAALEAAR